jgi:hypothetical protein
VTPSPRGPLPNAARRPIFSRQAGGRGAGLRVTVA